MIEPDLRDDDNLAEANAAEYGEAGAPLILRALAEGIAADASDPEEAMILCRDIAAAEELGDEDFEELVQLVEGFRDWELPRED